MHLAAALGVPVVAVFGPTDWRETAPVGEAHRVVREPVHCSPCGLRECPIDHRCMRRVTVDRVAGRGGGLLAAPYDGWAGRRSSSTVTGRCPTRSGTSTTSPASGCTLRGGRRAARQPQRLPGRARHEPGGGGPRLLPGELVNEVHAARARSLDAGGARLDGLYVLPAPPLGGRSPRTGDCDCRKPRPGPAAAGGGGAGRRPRALLGGGRPAGDLELAWTAGARAASWCRRATAAASWSTTRRRGRARPSSWPSTCWRRCSGSSPLDEGGGGVRRAPSAVGAPTSRRSWTPSTGKRVLVVADLVADEFLYGSVQRVSREAPVLILEYDSTDVRLGGGANAVHNISTLGGRPIPMGVARARRARPPPARAAPRAAHHRHPRGDGSRLRRRR